MEILGKSCGAGLGNPASIVYTFGGGQNPCEKIRPGEGRDPNENRVGPSWPLFLCIHKLFEHDVQNPYESIRR